MKIIVSNYDSIVNPYYSGGGAMAAHEICKRLSKNYDVAFYTGNFKGAKNRQIDGVKYKFVGSDIFGARFGNILFLMELLIKAQKNDYNLWIEGSSAPFTFSILPLFAKEKVISWVHMLAGEDMQRKYKLPFSFLEKYLSKNYDGFIVLSEWLKNKIKNGYKNTNKKFVIIPNGVSKINKPQPKKVANNAYLLYLGRLEINQKGIDLLIDSMSQMKNKSTKLVIAGNGDKKSINHLKKLIKINNLTKRVKLVGRVAGSKKNSLLKNCTALALPSRFDTYPLTILEAFSFAKPAVIYNLPQLSWIPNQTVLKSKSFDTKAYAKNLDKVTMDTKLRNDLSKKAYDFVKTKTWDKIYRQFKVEIKKYAKN